MGWGSRDKRGNTGGGSSSGKHGQKRGGKAATEHPKIDSYLNKKGGPGGDILNQPTQCPRCGGQGEIAAPKVEKDEDGTFSGHAMIKCPRCGGKGTL